MGDDHPDTLSAMHALALTYQAQGRNADAAEMQEQVLKKGRKILGDDHPDTLSAMHALALTYQAQGRNADAAEMQEQVLKKGRKILGDDHPDTLSAMHALALTYQAQGRNADAAEMQEQVLKKRRKILGDDHPDTLSAMHALALTYQAQGRNADAAAIQVLEKRRRILGEEHPDTLSAKSRDSTGNGNDEIGFENLPEKPVVEQLLELTIKNPSNMSFKKSLAYAYMAESRVDDAILIWGELVQRANRTDLSLVYELYKASAMKMSSTSRHAFDSYLYILLLVVLASITRFLVKLGFATGVNWWPIATKDDLMMIEPFMIKAEYNCVLP